MMDRASDESIKKYTQDEIVTHIVQLEDDYRRFVLKEADKYSAKETLLIISGLAREAMKYIHGNLANWEFIIGWVNDRLDELPQLKRETDEEKEYIHSIIEQVKEIRMKASPGFCPTCGLRKSFSEN